MVVKLLTLNLCDDCTTHELPETEAVTGYELAINGEPPLRILLCARCDLIWSPFIELVRTMGQSVTPAVSSTPRGKSRATPKAIETAERELPAVPQAEKPKKPVRYLVCPLAADHHDGEPARILYDSRNMHADQGHDKRMWEIRWEDPDGILKAFCTEHPLCKENHVGFPSKAALSQHIVYLRDRYTKEVSGANTPPERTDEHNSDITAHDN